MIENKYKIKNTECNKTHLDIEKAEDRGIIHRDYLAHSLRWTHTMKYLKKPGLAVLDVGCASAMLAQICYVNKISIDYYGVDIRLSQLEIADLRKLKNSLNLYCLDVTKHDLFKELGEKTFDLITCFEVAEHIPEKDLDSLLRNIRHCMHYNSTCLLSTPNYNEKDKAANHIKEYTMNELEHHLIKFFKIDNYYGTFASQTDIVPRLSVQEQYVFNMLKNYYDSNVLSVLFAPLHAKESRNILWVLKKL